MQTSSEAFSKLVQIMDELREQCPWDKKQTIHTLRSMTIEEKVGQMTQAEQNALVEVSDIENLFLGSLLSGGSSDPKAGNSLEAWTDMYDGYQKRALTTRLGIPLLFGIDAVHGHNNVLGAVIFPHNIGLGCTRNPTLVESSARVTAEEVRATGINWTFAPCVTVPRDERWGRSYEGFSESPDLVARLGEAAVRGFQRTDLNDPVLFYHNIHRPKGRRACSIDQSNTTNDELGIWARAFFLFRCFGNL